MPGCATRTCCTAGTSSSGGESAPWARWLSTDEVAASPPGCCCDQWSRPEVRRGPRRLGGAPRRSRRRGVEHRYDLLAALPVDAERRVATTCIHPDDAAPSTHLRAQPLGARPPLEPRRRLTPSGSAR